MQVTTQVATQVVAAVATRAVSRVSDYSCRVRPCQAPAGRTLSPGQMSHSPQVPAAATWAGPPAMRVPRDLAPCVGCTKQDFLGASMGRERDHWPTLPWPFPANHEAEPPPAQSRALPRPPREGEAILRDR